MRIDPSMTVSEIIQRHPGTALVLARFGLDACCGGKHPLELACRAHKVDPAVVLLALDAATGASTTAASTPAAAPGPAIVPSASAPRITIPVSMRTAAPTPACAQSGDPARQHIYRRFLKSALLFTLTGGTGLGAWALIMMAMRGRLGGMERGIIQVHGHWQLFGWVGLFVVGIAYQILPRMTGIPLPSHRAVVGSFVALTLGAVLRVGQSFDPSALRTALVYGSATLELVGCAIFAWTVARILSSQQGRLAPYQRYVALGTAWLVVAALLNLAHARDLLRSGRFEVAAWLNVPYLTVFLVGFVTFWILGVSLKTLPVFMRLDCRPRLATALALPLAAAVAVTAVSEALFLRGGGDTARIAFGLGGIAVAAGLVAFTWALGILSPALEDGVSGIAGMTGGTGPGVMARLPGVDPGYEKFVRLAYVWLVLAGLMLVAFSIVTLRGLPLDHAYIGAYRHALTVGFITTMMMGMAYRIVPVFRGVALWSTRLREITFWLLAVGNVIRVLFQSLSAAAGPVWLRVAGISGVLELAALVLFAVNLWKTMDAGATDGGTAAGRPATAPRPCDAPSPAA
jgi:uncharacterized protein involved in response to NO